jgi:hypothetical protein
MKKVLKHLAILPLLFPSLPYSQTLAYFPSVSVLGATTLSLLTLSITTLSEKTKLLRSAKHSCITIFADVINVVMLNIVLMSVVILNAVMLSVIMSNVIMLLLR